MLSIDDMRIMSSNCSKHGDYYRAVIEAKTLDESLTLLQDKQKKLKEGEQDEFVDGSLYYLTKHQGNSSQFIFDKLKEYQVPYSQATIEFMDGMKEDIDKAIDREEKGER